MQTARHRQVRAQSRRVPRRLLPRPRAPSQLRTQRFFSAHHRPTVIGGEHRFQQERQVTQQRLLRANFPLVNDVYQKPILLERPNASAIEISPSLERKSVRGARLRHPEKPVQGIRKPALGVTFPNLPTTIPLSPPHHLPTPLHASL